MTCIRLFLTTLPLLAVGVVHAAGVAGPVVEERSAAPVSVPVTAASPEGDAAVIVYEQLQQFQQQIEALTGRIEQLEHALSQATEQQRTQYIDLDGRLQSLQQAPAQPAADPVASTGSAEGSREGEGEERAAYEHAQSLVRDRKFDDAIKGFEQQLKQYPRGELAPQAMYWLGELWLAASAPDAPKAGRYFYRVYNEYPKHARASAAMYRHGLIQCQAGDVAKGRVTLNRVIVQHAGSPDAKLADAALKQQCR